MNMSLYKLSLKSHSRGLLIYIVSNILFLIGMICIFPSISQTDSISELMNSMPEGLLKAFGIKGELNTINDFLNMKFFNSLYLYILMAYCIATTVKLITKPIDRMYMLYYLSSQVSRTKVILTQFAVFITGLISIYLSTNITGLVGIKSILSSYEFDEMIFIKTNFTIFVMFLFMGVVCFLIATIANTEGTALIASSLVVVGSYVIDIFKKVSDDYGWLEYIDVFALYDPEKIAENFADIFKVLLILIFASLILLMYSIKVFKNKDLNI